MSTREDNSIKKVWLSRCIKQREFKISLIANETYFTYVLFVSWRSRDVLESPFIFEFELHASVNDNFMLSLSMHDAAESSEDFSLDSS